MLVHLGIDTVQLGGEGFTLHAAEGDVVARVELRVVAASYERFRPGYPVELLDLVIAYAGGPIRTALEFGAGTGKARRLFAQAGSATGRHSGGALFAQAGSATGRHSGGARLSQQAITARDPSMFVKPGRETGGTAG